ncbi:MAG: CDP-alcohol phosphatidyltransferase family protein [Bdellovibrionota bacterium]
MGLERRELTSRNTTWARSLARKLAHAGVTPNAISIFSIACAGLALNCFIYADHQRIVGESWRPFILLGAFFIQLRLVCNLMDGMVAVEHGKKTVLGDIFNDAPDRIADAFILMGAAFVAIGPHRIDFGWLCTALAILTAYFRTLAGAVGAKQRYLGPMAKQHRMATVTAACALVAIFPSLEYDGHNLMDAALLVVAVGALFTCWRRLSAMVADLKGESV